MPNMFGGDQFHPSYMPQELKEHEVEVGNTVYRILSTEPLKVEWESVEGKRQVVTVMEHLPREVRERIKEVSK